MGAVHVAKRVQISERVKKCLGGKHCGAHVCCAQHEAEGHRNQRWAWHPFNGSTRGMHMLVCHSSMVIAAASYSVTNGWARRRIVLLPFVHLRALAVSGRSFDS